MSGLPRQVISWPLSGGLETAKSPLSLQPGSHLTLDNVVQERENEWRRRNGFTQVASDTFGSALGMFHAANVGAAGMLAAGFNSGTPTGMVKKFSPAGGWVTSNLIGAQTPPDDISRIPVFADDSNVVGFASTGNLAMAATLGTKATLAVFDVTAGSGFQATPIDPSALGFTLLRVRCAATAAHLVAFGADTGGNLRAWVYDATTGAAISGPTTIKTGLHATQPYLGAMWYGGTTITVVCRTSADAVRFIEFNAATGALATDTTIAGVLCANCLALLADTGASGVRFVATSHTTPTTRVTRVSSAGAVLTDDQVEAVASTQIAGVGSNAGANWDVIYRTSTPAVKTNNKVGGIVQTPSIYSSFAEVQIDSEAWCEPASATVGGWNVLMGIHTSNALDPIDTWYIMQLYLGSPASPKATSSALVPMQGAAALALNASLYQVARTSARTFKFALPVLARYSDNAGTIRRDYSIDVFTQRLLDTNDIAVYPVGKPVPFRSSAFIPYNRLRFVDVTALSQGVQLHSVGTLAPPPMPTLTPSAAGGSLTALGTYFYRVVIEAVSSDGAIWESPPSEPISATLTAGQNRIVVDTKVFPGEDFARYYNVVLYRTAAGSADYRRHSTTTVQAGNSVSFTDTVADSALNKGAVLYTEGELQTAITPGFCHFALFGDRAWGVHREYRTELWPSKNLRPGRQPEFVEEGVVDIDDAYGDITGVVNLDDKGVVFKRNAIYFIQGEGLSDAGTGVTHNYVQVSADVGAIAGSPIVQAGDLIFFVSERGIYTVDRGANVVYVGAGAEQYLNQPLQQSKETVLDGCFVPLVNEVRFLTTNYVLVFDRFYNTWTRWNLAGFKRGLVINCRLVMFKSDGTLWREGDETQLTDQGTAFTGTIRSAWIRPGGMQGSLRLKKAMALGIRTSGGGNLTPSMKVYFDNSDTTFETFAPQAAIAAGTTPVLAQAEPGLHQRCNAFSLEITLPSGDNTFRLDGWAAEVAMKPGAQRKLGTTERWT